MGIHQTDGSDREIPAPARYITAHQPVRGYVSVKQTTI